ncbi:MAG: hypothetical protein ACYC6B_03095 [Thermoleophilia bacterium]
MQAGTERSRFITRQRVGLALLAVTLTVTLASRQVQNHDEATARFNADSQAAAPAHVRDISETVQASFISIFVRDTGGQLSSLMVGSGTDEFNALAQAIVQARPVTAATDASFDQLLVVSFGRGDTMDLTYSASRNQIICGEQAYEPPTDLTPLIDAVSKQMNY